jgi:hypothetical protein
VGYVDKNNKETSYKNLGYIGNGECYFSLLAMMQTNRLWQEVK